MNKTGSFNKSIPFVLFLSVLLVSVGCSKKEEQKLPGDTEVASGESATDQSESKNMFDVARISNGAKLFQEKCAQCHGPEAQGHPDWQRARIEGYSAAPPLNGTGTDIKLSRAKMMEIIRKGASRKGQPVMPAWVGRVSNQDIEDIITWYQALWPADVYKEWRRVYAADALPAAKGKPKG